MATYDNMSTERDCFSLKFTRCTHVEFDWHIEKIDASVRRLIVWAININLGN